MRVVAGTARGIRLDAPPGTHVRPTGDRVKEAVFNALGSLGLIEGASVLDLFAGSGALGIEALSRGAHHVTFVDRTKAAADVVRGNLARTRLEGATVVQRDAMRFCAEHRGERFDVALLDPPYDHDEWDDLLAVVPAAVVVIESNRLVELPERFQLLRERTYGSTVVRIAELRELPS